MPGHRVKEWREVKDYPDYLVNKRGDIKSFKQRKEGKIITSYINQHGYSIVTLRDKYGIPKTLSVHRLVAFAFLDLIEGKTKVNHKDGDKLNNSYLNLEWVTNSENIKHAYDVLNFNPNGKLINQLFNNKVIATFKSAEEASRKTGIDSSSIRKVCRGQRKKAGGYEWRGCIG